MAEKIESSDIEYSESHLFSALWQFYTKSTADLINDHWREDLETTYQNVVELQIEIDKLQQKAQQEVKRLIAKHPELNIVYVSINV